MSVSTAGQHAQTRSTEADTSAGIIHQIGITSSVDVDVNISVNALKAQIRQSLREQTCSCVPETTVVMQRLCHPAATDSLLGATEINVL
jgi:hypothetical protein